MRIEDIRRMAHDYLENVAIESDCIEYKKSIIFKEKILKTVCAFSNNYMNREIGLLYIGVEEVDDKETGEKAFPQRPIFGVSEGIIETTENALQSLLAYIVPKEFANIQEEELKKRISDLGSKNEITPQVTPQDTPQDTPQVVIGGISIYERIIEYCAIAHSKKDIMEHLGYKDIKNFNKQYLLPLIESGKITMTIPDKPNSKSQKYIAK